MVFFNFQDQHPSNDNNAYAIRILYKDLQDFKRKMETENQNIKDKVTELKAEIDTLHNTIKQLNRDILNVNTCLSIMKNNHAING